MLGAKIYGVGTNTLVIKGVDYLNGGIYQVIPDRIEAGTFMVAAAISKGYVFCRPVQPSNLKIVINKLREAGADIDIGKDWISLDMHGRRPKAVQIFTSPYPGFPTDMQAQFSLLNFIAKGVGVITETVFENRFMHVPQFIHMGVHAKINNNSIISYGVKFLLGRTVVASDLRSAVSLILAGCIADGITIVDCIYHVDRGYDGIEYKLRKMGANIERIR